MHLKRLAASKHYPIKRKETKFTVSPSPGPHKKGECIPLQIIIRDVLGYGSTAKEAKKIIKTGKIKIDGRVRKDHKYPVGLMGIVKIEEAGECYKVIPGKGKLTVSKISKKEAETKLCKITNKHIVKKGLVQLNLHDGGNILLNPKKDKNLKDYNTGDTLMISIPEKKIMKHLVFKKASCGVVVKGRHIGTTGTIKDVHIIKGNEPNKATIETDGKTIQTLKDNIFITGIK